MRYWYAILFMLLFNAGIGLVNSWNVFNTTQNAYPNWSYTSIAATFGCTIQNNTANSAGSCSTYKNSNNWFTSAIQTFGDWITGAFNFITAFSTGVFVPFWMLTNTFHLPVLFAGIWQAATIIIYASGWIRLISNRDMEN